MAGSGSLRRKEEFPGVDIYCDMTVYSYSQSSFNFYLARNTSRRGARNMVRVLENRFYYLDNFL
ncbi:MAG: hypothetical protein JWQ61_3293, partial [Collimonas fungivorans]|uniref:hypothetical protein n=1 Tax=Collimonas fungivorans TaxID=158899 RepID=UPI0026F112BF